MVSALQVVIVSLILIFAIMVILEVMVNVTRAILSRMEGREKESGGDSSGG